MHSMSSPSRRLLLGVMLSASATGTALGDESNDAYLEGIVMGTYQAASESQVDGQDVDNEANGELYLFGSLDMGPGSWQLEVRGSTTPRDHGVSSFYDANASVGETTDSGGDGRIAATQLFYELPVGPGDLRAGLLDPTAVLDTNDVANSEYIQFLAGPFVNNPTIGFPSFVLGGAYQGGIGAALDYKLFVGSSSGLEDPQDPTYHNVFDVGGAGKGAYTAAELGWQDNGYSLRAGLWYNTANQARLDRPGEDEHGYGFYTLIGGPAGPGQWNARAGIANDEVQADANFLSLAYSVPIGDSTLGAALARRGDSDHLPFDSAPIYQAEAYWRIHVAGGAYVSPDIQYIDNAGFRTDHDGVVIGGLRVGVEF